MHINLTLVRFTLLFFVALPAAADSFAECRMFFVDGRPPVHQSLPQARDLCFNEFAVMHSGTTKTPIYVAERLNGLRIKATHLKRTDQFFADARLPRGERAELDDYKGSGYDRGHMAPAADMTTPAGMAQSFSLANIVPQAPINNRKAWASIEKSTRQYAMRAAGDIFVISGVVYAGDPVSIGQGVRVPQYLYKLVHDPVAGKTWAHWIQNSDAASVGAPIGYRELGARIGMNLMPGLK